ncbi:MAG: OmpA family protein [Pseudomonadota bacterium]
MRRALLSFMIAVGAGGASSALELPARATLQASEEGPLQSRRVVTGSALEGRAPSQRTLEGVLLRQAWRIGTPGLTNGQVMDPLRAQLARMGFDEIFLCEARACGGFDFRFALEGYRAPTLFVSLNDYTYLAALSDATLLTLLVSRSQDASYLEVTWIGDPEVIEQHAQVALARQPEAVAPEQLNNVAQRDDALATALEAEGHAVLDDLAFRSGASVLADESAESLAALANYLRATPEIAITLVGHTDNEGSLDANVTLSLRRAEAVRDILTGRYGITAERVSAEGLGFLSPRASNATGIGREANRRVEVVVIRP